MTKLSNEVDTWHAEVIEILRELGIPELLIPDIIWEARPFRMRAHALFDVYKTVNIVDKNGKEVDGLCSREYAEDFCRNARYPRCEECGCMSGVGYKNSGHHIYCSHSDYSIRRHVTILPFYNSIYSRDLYFHVTYVGEVHGIIKHLSVPLRTTLVEEHRRFEEFYEEIIDEIDERHKKQEIQKKKIWRNRKREWQKHQKVKVPQRRYREKHNGKMRYR